MRCRTAVSCGSAPFSRRALRDENACTYLQRLAPPRLDASHQISRSAMHRREEGGGAGGGDWWEAQNAAGAAP